jgi:hypothetical protein
MAMAVQQIEERDSTTKAVVAWRYEQLRRVGFERREARLISRRSDVDLHLAIDLLRSGCPPELALAILL